MSISKNFVIKNGIEVRTDLIVGDAYNGKVGIATTSPRYTLHVNGGIGATDLNVSGVTTSKTLNVTDTGTLGTLVVQGTASALTGVITNIQGTNLNYGGIGTITNLSSTSIQATNANVSGIATLGTVKVSSGIVTATSGVVTYYGDGSKLSNIITGVGIQSAGNVIGYGVSTLNFIGVGNTFAYNPSTNTVDVSIRGGGGNAGFATYNAGIATASSVGINTTNLDDQDLTGIGNSFKGLYIGNGMIIVDNQLNGNHYIGTNFNGLMAGPVTINGTLTVDGNYVVV